LTAFAKLEQFVVRNYEERQLKKRVYLRRFNEPEDLLTAFAKPEQFVVRNYEERQILYFIETV
jgi:hypothetical protein